MAWGCGLYQSPAQGPFKKEGDGRSPAGVFALPSAFGSAEALPADAPGFPYLHTLATTYCVEEIAIAECKAIRFLHQRTRGLNLAP